MERMSVTFLIFFFTGLLKAKYSNVPPGFPTALFVVADIGRGYNKAGSQNPLMPPVFENMYEAVSVSSDHVKYSIVQDTNELIDHLFISVECEIKAPQYMFEGKGGFSILMDDNEKKYTQTLVYSNFYISDRVTMKPEVTRSKEFLTNAARTVLERGSTTQFFKEFGTHYLTSLNLGCALQVNFHIKGKDTEEIMDIKAFLEFKLGLPGGMSVSGKGELEIGDTKKVLDEHITCEIHAIGVPITSGTTWDEAVAFIAKFEEAKAAATYVPSVVGYDIQPVAQVIQAMMAPPTFEPTHYPTTSKPTFMPTTSEPTLMPTPRPTGGPTPQPTYAPTDIPSMCPSRSPTEVTSSPTAAPTRQVFPNELDHWDPYWVGFWFDYTFMEGTVLNEFGRQYAGRGQDMLPLIPDLKKKWTPESEDLIDYLLALAHFNLKPTEVVVVAEENTDSNATEPVEAVEAEGEAEPAILSQNAYDKIDVEQEKILLKNALVQLRDSQYWWVPRVALGDDEVEETLSPTMEPTKRPTRSPIPRPTPSPTSPPTLEPTLEPVDQPTFHPSFMPSKTPTRPPIPTFEPTYKPTLGAEEALLAQAEVLGLSFSPLEQTLFDLRLLEAGRVYIRAMDLKMMSRVHVDRIFGRTENDSPTFVKYNKPRFLQSLDSFNKEIDQVITTIFAYLNQDWENLINEEVPIGKESKIMQVLENKYAEMSGEGVLDYNDGCQYVGYVSHHMPFYEGTMKCEDFTYLGEWRDGFEHGYGRLTMRTGDTFTGEFRNGQFHGEDVIYQWMSTDEIKETYMGRMWKGKRSGHGKMVYEGKNHYSEYDGVWQNDQKQGRGILKTTVNMKVNHPPAMSAEYNETETDSRRSLMTSTMEAEPTRYPSLTPSNMPTTMPSNMPSGSPTPEFTIIPMSIATEGDWIFDERPQGSIRICPQTCSHTIAMNIDLLTEETECSNPVEGDLCNAACLDGYEGPDVTWECNGGSWLPASESSCQPSWLLYTGNCYRSTSTDEVRNEYECLNSCENDETCEGFKFDHTTGCHHYNDCEHGIYSPWCEKDCIEKKPYCDDETPCGFDRVCGMPEGSSMPQDYCMACSHFTADLCPAPCEPYEGKCVQCTNDDDCGDSNICDVERGHVCKAKCAHAPNTEDYNFVVNDPESCKDLMTGDACSLTCPNGFIQQQNMKAHCVDGQTWSFPDDCEVDFYLDDKTYEAYEFVGCYVNDLEEPDLKFGPQEDGYIPVNCALQCRGYTYFALSDGGVCTCDMTYNTPSDKYMAVSFDQCNDYCTDDPQAKLPCGGKAVNAVYRFKPVTCNDLEVQETKWYDANGRTCEWFLERRQCGPYGRQSGYGGLTPNEACCSCRDYLPFEYPEEKDGNDDRYIAYDLCDNFNGIMVDDYSGCIPEECKDVPCGIMNSHCCINENVVCGIDGNRAPCSVAKDKYCRMFDGVPDTINSVCCPAHCGNYCGADNCLEMGEECCGNVPPTAICGEYNNRHTDLVTVPCRVKQEPVCSAVTKYRNQHVRLCEENDGVCSHILPPFTGSCDKFCEEQGLICLGGWRQKELTVDFMCEYDSSNYEPLKCSETGFNNHERKCRCGNTLMWSNWEPWTTCTRKCGGGTRLRQRKWCRDPHFNDCEEIQIDTSTCNNTPCPIAGKWSPWTNWQVDGDVEGRHRSCTNPIPQYGGSDCWGDAHQDRFLDTPEADFEWAAALAKDDLGCFSAFDTVSTPKGRRFIKDVRVGDFVETVHGEDVVVQAGCAAEEKRFHELSFSNGGKLHFTEDHYVVLTNGVWKLAKDVRVGDKLRQKDEIEVTIESVGFTKGQACNIVTQSQLIVVNGIQATHFTESRYRNHVLYYWISFAVVGFFAVGLKDKTLFMLLCCTAAFAATTSEVPMTTSEAPMTTEITELYDFVGKEWAAHEVVAIEYSSQPDAPSCKADCQYTPYCSHYNWNIKTHLCSMFKWSFSETEPLKLKENEDVICGYGYNFANPKHMDCKCWANPSCPPGSVFGFDPTRYDANMCPRCIEVDQDTEFSQREVYDCGNLGPEQKCTTVQLHYLLSMSTQPKQQLGKDELYDLLVDEVFPKLFPEESKDEHEMYGAEITHDMPVNELILQDELLQNIDLTKDIINGLRKAIWKSFQDKTACWLGDNAFSRCIQPYCGQFMEVQYMSSAINGASCCPMYECVARERRATVCPYVSTVGEMTKCADGFTAIREYFEVQNGVVCKGVSKCYPAAEAAATATSTGTEMADIPETQIEENELLIEDVLTGDAVVEMEDIGALFEAGLDTSGEAPVDTNEKLLTVTRKQTEELEKVGSVSICAFHEEKDCPVKRCRDGEYKEIMPADPMNGICCETHVCKKRRCEPTELGGRCADGFCAEVSENAGLKMVCVNPAPYIDMEQIMLDMKFEHSHHMYFDDKNNLGFLYYSNDQPPPAAEYRVAPSAIPDTGTYVTSITQQAMERGIQVGMQIVEVDTIDTQEMGRQEIKNILSLSHGSQLSMTLTLPDHHLSDHGLTSAVSQLDDKCRTRSCTTCHYPCGYNPITRKCTLGRRAYAGVCAPEAPVELFMQAKWECPMNSVLPACADRSADPPDCRACISMYIDGNPMDLQMRKLRKHVALGEEIMVDGTKKDYVEDTSVLEVKGTRRVNEAKDHILAYVGPITGFAAQFSAYWSIEGIDNDITHNGWKCVPGNYVYSDEWQEDVFPDYSWPQALEREKIFSEYISGLWIEPDNLDDSGLMYCRYKVTMDTYHIEQLEACHGQLENRPCVVDDGSEPYNGVCNYQKKIYDSVRPQLPICGSDLWDLYQYDDCLSKMQDLAVVNSNLCDCYRKLSDADASLLRNCKRIETDVYSIYYHYQLCTPPTLYPTQSPSMSPTTDPTPMPSLAPSTVPTKQPTEFCTTIRVTAFGVNSTQDNEDVSDIDGVYEGFPVRFGENYIRMEYIRPKTTSAQEKSSRFFFYEDKALLKESELPVQYEKWVLETEERNLYLTGYNDPLGLYSQWNMNKYEWNVMDKGEDYVVQLQIECANSEYYAGACYDKMESWYCDHADCLENFDTSTDYTTQDHDNTLTYCRESCGYCKVVDNHCALPTPSSGDLYTLVDVAFAGDTITYNATKPVPMESQIQGIHCKDKFEVYPSMAELGKTPVCSYGSWRDEQGITFEDGDWPICMQVVSGTVSGLHGALTLRLTATDQAKEFDIDIEMYLDQKEAFSFPAYDLSEHGYTVEIVSDPQLQECLPRTINRDGDYDGMYDPISIECTQREATVEIDGLSYAVMDFTPPQTKPMECCDPTDSSNYATCFRTKECSTCQTTKIKLGANWERAAYTDSTANALQKLFLDGHEFGTTKLIFADGTYINTNGEIIQEHLGVYAEDGAYYLGDDSCDAKLLIQQKPDLSVFLQDMFLYQELNYWESMNSEDVQCADGQLSLTGTGHIRTNDEYRLRPDMLTATIRSSIRKEQQCDNHYIVLSSRTDATWESADSFGFGWDCDNKTIYSNMDGNIQSETVNCPNRDSNELKISISAVDITFEDEHCDSLNLALDFNMFEDLKLYTFLGVHQDQDKEVEAKWTYFSMVVDDYYCPDQILPADNNRYEYGCSSYLKTCTVECAAGYSGISSDYTCVQEGTRGEWSGTLPDCHKSCAAYEDADTYKMDCAENTHGSLCSPQCHLGFQNVGSENYICTEGEWVPEQPESPLLCEPFQCPMLSIDQGFVDINYPLSKVFGLLEHGSTAIFSCRDDYVMTKPSSYKLTCDNGMWDGVPPKCAPTTCTDGVVSRKYGYDVVLNINGALVTKRVYSDEYPEEFVVDDCKPVSNPVIGTFAETCTSTDQTAYAVRDKGGKVITHAGCCEDSQPSVVDWSYQGCLDNNCVVETWENDLYFKGDDDMYQHTSTNAYGIFSTTFNVESISISGTCSVTLDFGEDETLQLQAGDYFKTELTLQVQDRTITSYTANPPDTMETFLAYNDGSIPWNKGKHWGDYCEDLYAVEYFRFIMEDSTSIYIRPIAGTTYCDMLTSNDKHEYAMDPSGPWNAVVNENADEQSYGGSSDNNMVPFWGHETQPGAKYGGVWGKQMTVYYMQNMATCDVQNFACGSYLIQDDDTYTCDYVMTQGLVCEGCCYRGDRRSLHEEQTRRQLFDKNDYELICSTTEGVLLNTDQPTRTPSKAPATSTSPTTIPTYQPTQLPTITPTTTPTSEIVPEDTKVTLVFTAETGEYADQASCMEAEENLQTASALLLGVEKSAVTVEGGCDEIGRRRALEQVANELEIEVKVAEESAPQARYLLQSNRFQSMFFKTLERRQLVITKIRVPSKKTDVPELEKVQKKMTSKLINAEQRDTTPHQEYALNDVSAVPVFGGIGLTVVYFIIILLLIAGLVSHVMYVKPEPVKPDHRV